MIFDEWERNPALPTVKYEDGDNINTSALTDDIVARLKQRKFTDYGEYEDAVGKVLEELWPNWMKYFPPLDIFPFQRAVRNAIRQKVDIDYD